MKVQKKESKQSGNPARSLILVTVCTCTAIAFAAGGRIADFNGKNKVYSTSFIYKASNGKVVYKREA